MAVGHISALLIHGEPRCARQAKAGPSASVFVSDVHLGSRDCRAEELLKFLKSVEVDYLFLVGDIVDFWSLRRTSTGRRSTTTCCARSSARPRRHAGHLHPRQPRREHARVLRLGVRQLEIRRQYVHATADGRELLVMHGDEFDAAVKCSRWLAKLRQPRLRRHAAPQSRRERGAGACSDCRTGRSRATSNTAHERRAIHRSFEHAAAQPPRSRKLDGIVCGHIHRAGMRDIDGVHYCNDGDWVESCTALVEDMNGALSLWHRSICTAAASRRRWSRSPRKLQYSSLESDEFTPCRPRAL